MGSDRSHKELFEGVLKASRAYDSSHTFLVIATESAIQEIEEAYGKTPIRFHKASEVILMTDEPLYAIKHKKNSSLLVGARLLKKKKIDALVTTGNTGALITAASLCLPKFPGIKRPALLATLPSAKGYVSVIDAGGTVQLRASLLHQYAKLGATYHRIVYGIDAPKLGLLNVGNESKKGTLEHQEAFKLLSSLPGFVGNVEGRGIFDGSIDVLVTDGFTGNVLLKSAEGVAGFIFDHLVKQVSAPLQDELTALKTRFDWTDYPGAMVMGVEGIMIKCHGSSSAQALFSGIKGAITLVDRSFLSSISSH